MKTCEVKIYVVKTKLFTFTDKDDKTDFVQEGRI